MKIRQWQSIVMYVSAVIRICMWNDSGLRYGGLGVCSPRKIFSLHASEGDK